MCRSSDVCFRGQGSLVFCWPKPSIFWLVNTRRETHNCGSLFSLLEYTWKLQNPGAHWCTTFAEYSTYSNRQEMSLWKIWRRQGTGEFHAIMASISVPSMLFTFPLQKPLRNELCSSSRMVFGGRREVWPALHGSAAGHPKLFLCCSSESGCLMWNEDLHFLHDSMHYPCKAYFIWQAIVTGNT